MTRTTNARLAGFLFLFYIGIAFPAMVLFGRVSSGAGIAAKLANVAQHAGQVRLVILLSLVTIFVAMALAVALYAITRDVDPDLARLALFCRVGEGLVSTVSIVAVLGLLSVATAAAGVAAPDAAAANALGSLLLKVQSSSTTLSATLFAVGSTLFAYLFLRARSIPAPLAGLGLVASVLVVLVLPAQLVGLVRGRMGELVWAPMLVFEVALGFWLLVKGAARPAAPGDRASRRGNPLEV